MQETQIAQETQTTQVAQTTQPTHHTPADQTPPSLEHITLGCIGFGAMGSAIAQGLIDQGIVAPEQIIASAAHYDALVARTADRGIRAVHSAQEVVEQADIVILAVKPYLYEHVCNEIVQSVAQRTAQQSAHGHAPIIVSIAAGMNLEKLTALLPGAHAICTVPNTPIAVGKGIMVTEDVDTLSAIERELFDGLFSTVSLVERVDTAHINIAGTVAGCAPAYTAMFIEALADAGVKYGLKRTTAYRLAGQMVAGTGALQVATGAHPAAMKDAVCSPGGTTIRGVAALEQHGFRGAIISAIDAIEGK